MALLLPNYKNALFDDIVKSITSNSSYYYVAAANPIAWVDDVPAESNTSYYRASYPNWTMLFGKKLANTDVAAMISKTIWASNTAYDRFDDQVNLANSSYYVIVNPTTIGGDYTVFKCIDNANGAVSTDKPDQIQAETFEKSDGYMWRYIASITTAQMTKFGTTDYAPVFPNTAIVTSALLNSTVDVVLVTNSGSGYSSYHDGIIRGVSNSTVLQIESTASNFPDFYTNNAIYVYNSEGDTSGQLFKVDSFFITGNTKYVSLNAAANTSLITSGVTQYKISPRIAFDTDGTDPVAYSVVNSQSNTIDHIVVVESGQNISRATATVVSNSSFGTGATVRPIVPPPGGHGSNPIAELNIKGIGIGVTFSNSESNTIPTNVPYNKICLIKDPYAMYANGAKSTAFTSAAFSQVLKANVTPNTVFTVGQSVTGETSGAIGVVAFSNSSTLYLAGDKLFISGETVSGNGLSANISITTRGSIYQQEVSPLYMQNTDNITRSNTQAETFKIVIEL